jgi:hypothetical protein
VSGPEKSSAPKGAQIDDDRPPEKLVFSLLGRAAFNAQSLHAGINRDYVRSEPYITDLVLQRKGLRLKWTILYFSSLIISFVVITYTNPISIPFEYNGLDLSMVYFGNEVINVILAMTFSTSIVTLLNLNIMDQLIRIALFHNSVYSPEYIAARHDPTQLFTELLQIHNVGYKSQFGHRTFIVIAFVIMLGFSLVYFTFIPFASWLSLERSFSAGGFFERFLAGFSFSATCAAVALYVLVDRRIQRIP